MGDALSSAFIETGWLCLRPLTADHAPSLFELDGDPEVMRFLSGGPGTPLEQIRDEILPRFLAYAERAPWAGVWAAELRDTGRFAGWFSLRPAEDPAQGRELGYRLRREYWGCGLATEGSRALLTRAFQLGMPRVIATTYEHSLGSRRVMEKLGLRLLRTFRLEPEQLAAEATYAAQDAEVWDGDDVEYGLTREEWLGQDG